MVLAEQAAEHAPDESRWSAALASTVLWSLLAGRTCVFRRPLLSRTSVSGRPSFSGVFITCLVIRSEAGRISVLLHVAQDLQSSLESLLNVVVRSDFCQRVNRVDSGHKPSIKLRATAGTTGNVSAGLVACLVPGLVAHGSHLTLSGRVRTTGHVRPGTRRLCSSRRHERGDSECYQ